MTRTRSEYRLALSVVKRPDWGRIARRPLDGDRSALAALMLDAYSGTIDDEGEDMDDALVAVDLYLSRAVRDHSLIVTEADRVLAMAFVVVVDDLHYIDPIVVASDHKRQGLGRDAVRMVLASLAAAGVEAVGATITDGNTASEQLFVGLGFSRIGPWT